MSSSSSNIHNHFVLQSDTPLWRRSANSFSHPGKPVLPLHLTIPCRILNSRVASYIAVSHPIITISHAQNTQSPQIPPTKISLPLVFFVFLFSKKKKHKWFLLISSNHQKIKAKKPSTWMSTSLSLFFFFFFVTFVEVCEILLSLYYHIIISSYRFFSRTILYFYLQMHKWKKKMHKLTECCVDMQYWTEGNIGLRRSHASRTKGCWLREPFSAKAYGNMNLVT